MQSRSMFEKTRKYYNKLWCNKHISKTMYRSSRPEVSCKKVSLGAVHMEIVFLLLSRLPGKKILFPRVHIRNISPPGRDLFWQAVRWENFERSQYSKWVTQTWRKMASNTVLLYLKILAFDSDFMFGGSSMSIRYSKPT